MTAPTGVREAWKRDVIGTRVNMLVVVDYLYTDKNGSKFLWQCDCGKKVIIRYRDVTGSNRKSCGCARVFLGNPGPRKNGGTSHARSCDCEWCKLGRMKASAAPRCECGLMKDSSHNIEMCRLQRQLVTHRTGGMVLSNLTEGFGSRKGHR